MSQDPRAGHKIAVEVEQEYNHLEGKRGNWDNLYQQIASRIWPNYAGHAQAKNAVPSPGVLRNTEVIDASGVIALTRFAAVCMSMLTPQGQRWHTLAPSDPVLKRHRAVREYFEEWTRILFEYRYAPKANYVGQKQEEYMGLGAFGTGPMYIDRFRMFGEKGLRYKSIPVFGVQIRTNHQGLIDAMYRKFTYQARQAIQRFGADNLPPIIAEDAKDPKRADRDHWFIHCVKPREDYQAGRLDLVGMRYAEYYVCLTEKFLTEQAGYDVFPYSCSRYMTGIGEDLGRSPAMLCLPSLKTLNEEKKTILKQGHKAVDPVLLLHDDGVVDTASIRPGGYIPGGMSAEGRPLVGTLPVGNVALGHEMMGMETKIIEDAFLINLFQLMIESPQKTATEVVELAREKGVFLSPTLGRQESESLGPQIEREIDVLSKQGIGPPMPAILREARGEYQTVFDSPLSRMAKVGEASGFMRTIDWATEKAVALQRPDMLDVVNWETALPELLENQNTPLRWINSQERLKALQEQRAKMAQQQQMAEMAPAASNVMKTVMQTATGG